MDLPPDLSIRDLADLPPPAVTPSPGPAGNRQGGPRTLSQFADYRQPCSPRNWHPVDEKRPARSLPAEFSNPFPTAQYSTSNP